MNVPSPQFLLFAAVAALIFNLGKSDRWRSGVFLACNLIFLVSQMQASATRYGYLASLAPYAAFLLIGYVLVWTIQKEAIKGGGARERESSAKAFHIAAILLIVFTFFWLKKYSFLPSGLWLHWSYLTVGLSYVFFRVLHLVIDAHDVDDLGRVGPLDYLNYTLNFTSLVSGPIQRYEDYARMTKRQPAALDWASMGRAVERIIIGLFKVTVLQGLLAAVQRHYQGELLAGGPFWDRARDGALIVAVYPLFLYFNFSGYTDFVIGVARFFGLKLPENFDRPFSSTSFIEYWSRWHITLSDWLKTYVYTPLLKTFMVRIPARAAAPYLSVFALFVTFFLIGIWHGRTSEFVVFGLLNGGGVAGNQIYRVVMAKRLGKKSFAQLGRHPFYRAICRGLMYEWLAFSLIWFWSDWPQIDQIFGSLAWMGTAACAVLIWLWATLVLAALEALHSFWSRRNNTRRPFVPSRYLRTAWASALVVIIAAVTMVLESPAPDIVYKTF